MEVSHQAKENFLETLWTYYHDMSRDALPWRQSDSMGSFDPYRIMVSELMLQQTQVSRVIPKYEAFISIFPDVHTLAKAELGDVLRAWQGLGYNRRAKFLWQAAQRVVELGYFPDTQEGLVQLPGIGVNTAGAILTYAYNAPVVFIETNVRTVFLYHFFAGQVDVSDKEITSVLRQVFDQEQPREFYWALMDYGTHLKATVGNLNKASKHYVKQSKFEGSARQVRGKIIRLLGQRSYGALELKDAIGDERYDAVLSGLLAEGMVRLVDDQYVL